VAAAEVEVFNMVDVEAYRLFIGTLKSTLLISEEARPLIYADYHRVKKGKSHVNAPTAVFNSLK
jgi:hypothetical protein